MSFPRHLAGCAPAIALFVMAASPLTRAAGPEVRSLLPAGGQRGTSVEITASGNFPKWPVQGWVDRPGVTLIAASDKGKLSAAISADASPGLYWLRVYDAYGASAPQPFIVGTLGEIVEQEPNDSPQKAQTLAMSAVVVNGRLGAARDADLFAVGLQKGQTLVASLEAHETLGSPFDGVLQLVSPRGNVLAYNHDQHGLDPQIVFAAPLDGRYLVRVFGFPSTPNSTVGLAGGDPYVYRLTLTTGAYVDYPWPLAVTLGRETRVELLGWNIPDSLKSVLVKAEGPRSEIFDPQLANVVPLAVEPHNTLVEVEPNEPATPQPIELPVTVTGRIESRRDVDVFSFAAKKAEPLVFQLESRSLGYPLDAVLEISDAAGKSLARVDDSDNSRDCVLAFSPPDDGPYRIAVSDLTRQGGPRHVYLLRATRAPADFEVTADAHAYVLTAGKPTEITLSIARRGGFDEAIAFSVAGLPDFATAAAPQSTAQGDSAKTVKVTLSTAGGAFSGAIHVECHSAGASKMVRTAAAAIGGHNARTSNLWLTVVPASP